MNDIRRQTLKRERHNLMVTVVDDDASVRKALGRLMRSVGYAVTTFPSAEEFLATNAATECDCLVLDVHLPGKSGLELQSELALSGLSRPTIFITAFDDEGARRQALQTGALEFLQKPLDCERLLDVIAGVLKSG